MGNMWHVKNWFRVGHNISWPLNFHTLFGFLGLSLPCRFFFREAERKHAFILSYLRRELPDVIEKYRGDNYFSKPFQAHQLNSFHYAMPILFSPSILLLNLELSADFGRDLGPYDLTWDTLAELAEYARKKGIPLCGDREILNLFRCLIYADTPNDTLTEIDVKKLKQRIHKAWPVLTERTSGTTGKHLLIWSCRQAI